MAKRTIWVLYRPAAGCDWRPIEVSSDENGSTLAALQALVGGYIERVPVDHLAPVPANLDIWVNEDGIGLGMSPNLPPVPGLDAKTGKPCGLVTSLVVGPAVATVADPETGETLGIESLMSLVPSAEGDVALLLEVAAEILDGLFSGKPCRLRGEPEPEPEAPRVAPGAPGDTFV